MPTRAREFSALFFISNEKFFAAGVDTSVIVSDIDCPDVRRKSALSRVHFSFKSAFATHCCGNRSQRYRSRYDAFALDGLSPRYPGFFYRIWRSSNGVGRTLWDYLHPTTWVTGRSHRTKESNACRSCDLWIFSPCLRLCYNAGTCVNCNYSLCFWWSMCLAFADGDFNAGYTDKRSHQDLRL